MNVFAIVCNSSVINRATQVDNLTRAEWIGRCQLVLVDVTVHPITSWNDDARILTLLV